MIGSLNNLLRAQWDRAVAIVAVIVGLLALLFGYIGISGEALVGRQLPYIISGGLFGIFMLGIAAVSWITADMRDEWRELRSLRGVLEADAVLVGAAAATDAASGADTTPSVSLDS